MNAAHLAPLAARLRRGLLLIALPAALMAPPALATDPAEFSQAETLVFVEKHLDNVSGAASLRYSFVRSGTQPGGFSDEVRIDIDPARKVTARFLSGTRKLNLPDIDQAEANPVILYFLENDIRELQRLTDRKTPNYFRNRIRKTLVDEAVIRDTQITYNGQPVAAQEITLLPYAKDPARERYARYAEKRYTFVLSKAVPGGVYQLRTLLPGALPSDAPVVEEVLTLDGPTSRATTAPSNPPAKTK